MHILMQAAVAASFQLLGLTQPSDKKNNLKGPAFHPGIIRSTFTLACFFSPAPRLHLLPWPCLPPPRSFLLPALPGAQLLLCVQQMR